LTARASAQSATRQSGRLPYLHDPALVAQIRARARSEAEGALVYQWLQEQTPLWSA